MIPREVILKDVAGTSIAWASMQAVRLGQVTVTELCEAFCKGMIGLHNTRGMMISVGDSDETNPLHLLQKAHADEVSTLRAAGQMLADELHDVKAELHDTQTQESLLDRKCRDLLKMNDNQLERIQEDGRIHSRLRNQISELGDGVKLLKDCNATHQEQRLLWLARESYEKEIERLNAKCTRAEESLKTQREGTELLAKEALRAQAAELALREQLRQSEARRIELSKSLDDEKTSHAAVRTAGREVYEQLRILQQFYQKEQAIAAELRTQVRNLQSSFGIHEVRALKKKLEIARAVLDPETRHFEMKNGVPTFYS